MNQTHTAALAATAIPSIDQAVPKKLETATFATG